MKTNFILTGVLFFVWFICGCSSQAENIAIPAVISEPSASSNTELQGAIASLLGKKQVLIASDAFTKNNSLTIERVAHSAQNGQLINGRVTEKPSSFRLVIRGEKCFVQNTESEEERVLEVTKCDAQ